MVCLGRGLHEGTFPLLSHGFSFTAFYLSILVLIIFVTHQHYWNVFYISFNLTYLFVDRLEFLQGLSAGDRVNQNKSMPFRNRETLHGWKLMAPRSVSDLQSAYAFITADHLPIGVFNGGDVALSESALHKPQDQRTFAHSSSSKHNYPIIIALLRHISLCVTCSARAENLGEKTTKTRRQTLVQVPV